jgi:glycosyltransferase involved in cell wall biosynthesis
MDLQCSVIVPSYNRRATLEMVLAGLAAQTLAGERFEVLVVLDGGSDDSAAMLARWRDEGRIRNLRWLTQPNSGQAAARNNGAQAARAPILVFLDDDVVPEPELLEAHLRWYDSDERLTVLGDCLIVRERRESLYHLMVWAWWEDMYRARALPGRRPGIRDFCAGNFSLRRADLLHVGGFDTDFRGYGGEDFELGHRLLRGGVRFVADRGARARHYHRTSVAGVLRATRQEAHGDKLLGLKHPELLPGLRLARLPGGRYALLALLAMFAPALGDLLMRLLQAALPLYERLQLRRLWQSWFDHIRGYSYWRGVRDAFGSWRALRAYQRTAPPLPRQSLDLSAGLPALPDVWVDGPSVLELRVGGARLGEVYLPRAIEAPLRDYLAEQIYAQLGPQLWRRLRREPALARSLGWLDHPHLPEATR